MHIDEPLPNRPSDIIMFIGDYNLVGYSYNCLDKLNTIHGTSKHKSIQRAVKKIGREFI